MDWIDQLEKDAWNVVIDELVWHLREGRKPVIIRKHFLSNRGIEFCFETAKPMFLAVEGNLLEDHWKEAVAIIGRFPQLSALKTQDA